MDTYTVIGKGFDLIPSDAIGIFANHNDDPLEFLNDNRSDLLFGIVTKENTRMVLICQNPIAHTRASFLGGIVSSDRQTVYWENNTNPLP